MSDVLGRGITVTEIASMDQSIDIPSHTTAAFIGRALRGPLNTPVLVDSFAAFARRFGGIWLRSSLGPAVQQFFEHGGKRLYIVRVANNARGAMICLRGDHNVMVIRALEPGSSEQLRAAIDYDGIVDEDLFNLTIQRISPETGLVVDQEIYSRVTCDVASRYFIGDALLNSTLARIEFPLPAGRPAETKRPELGTGPAYEGHAEHGSDGSELFDYDLVGCRRRNSGIFALDQIDHFDILYMPPTGKHRDVGPTAILAAELYCRKRGAMLITDPAEHWDSIATALDGVRDAGIFSPNIVSYYPRMISSRDTDRRARPVGGAMAGLLCKLDRICGPWQTLDQRGFGFDRRLTPAIEVNLQQEQSLVREGINVIARRNAVRATLNGSVTLGRCTHMERSSASLAVRRLCLMMTNTIDRATRWAVFEANNVAVAKRIQSLVHAYLSALADAGAFVDDRFSVQCDAGLHTQPVDPHRGVTLLLSFHPVGVDEPVSFTLHQTVSGCRVATTAFAPSTAECA